MKHETHFTLNNVGSRHSLFLVGSEIWPVYVILQKMFYNFLSKNYVKNVSWKLVQALFNFHQRILHQMESKGVCVLIWANFDSFVIEVVFNPGLVLKGCSFCRIF